MLSATSRLPINFAVDAARELEKLCKEKVTYFKGNPTADGVVDAAKIKKLERLIAALIAYIDLLEREKITALGDDYVQHCMAELEAAIKEAEKELRELQGESEEDFESFMKQMREVIEKQKGDISNPQELLNSIQEKIDLEEEKAANLRRELANERDNDEESRSNRP